VCFENDHETFEFLKKRFSETDKLNLRKPLKM